MALIWQNNIKKWNLFEQITTNLDLLLDAITPKLVSDHVISSILV
jgi:hypothetical protein